MSWIITKGQELLASDDHHERIFLSRNCWANKAKVVNVSLMASDLDVKPKVSYDTVSDPFAGIDHMLTIEGRLQHCGYGDRS